VSNVSKVELARVLPLTDWKVNRAAGFQFLVNYFTVGKKIAGNDGARGKDDGKREKNLERLDSKFLGRIDTSGVF